VKNAKARRLHHTDSITSAWQPRRRSIGSCASIRSPTSPTIGLINERADDADRQRKGAGEDFKEFLAYIKKNKDKVSYANAASARRRIFAGCCS